MEGAVCRFKWHATGVMRVQDRRVTGLTHTCRRTLASVSGRRAYQFLIPYSGLRSITSKVIICTFKVESNS
jgi:hypothetical protein